MLSCLALIPDDTERVYLAYSGGLDSSVLLHLLVNSDRDFELVPWHINHGLLDAAAAMEKFCIEQAQHYGLEIRVDHLDLGNIDSNIEAEARQRRYQIFEPAIGNHQCLLSAHHADDQAETFLLNALRGSGSAGLRGIARCREFGRGLLLRPLLDTSRQQLEEYANRHEIPWFNDPSNQLNRFDRNYLRNEVIPVIRKRWPHFHDALTTASRLQSETQQLLEELAQQDFAALARSSVSGDATLDVSGLLQLTPGRCRNLLRYWVAAAELAAIPGPRLNELLRQLRARPDAMPRIALPGYSIRLYDKRLFLVRNGDLSEHSGVFEFGLQGLIQIPSCDLCLRRADLFQRLQMKDEGQEVTIRYRNNDVQNSDRHRLKRLFQNQRVPPWERDSVALVYLDEKLSGLLP